MGNSPPVLLPSTSHPKFPWLLGGALLLAACLETLFFAAYGEVMYPDEGFYLTAVNRVLRGEVLYRDFPYFQAPLLPYAYAALSPLIEPNMWGGRVISCLFSAGCWAVFLWLAWKGGGRAGMAFSGLLLLSSVLVPHIFSVTAAYGSLANLFLLGTLASLALPWKLRTRLNLGAVCLALAVGVRLPFITVTLPFFGYGAWLASREGGALRRKNLVMPSAIFLGILGAIFGPFLILGPEQTVWNNWLVQQVRAEQMPLWWDKPPGYYFWNKLVVLKSVVLANLPLIIALLLLWWKRDLGRRERLLPENWHHFLLALCVVHSVAHLLPKPTWNLYFITTTLILLLPAGRWLAEQWQTARSAGKQGAIIAFTGVLLWSQFIAQGGVWRWVSLPPHITVLEEMAAFIEANSRPGDEVMTFMTPLVVDAHREVPRGLEMSFFGYYPDWSVEECRRHGIVNNQILLEWVQSREPAVLVLTEFETKQGMAHDPAMARTFQKAVNAHYRLAKEARGWKDVVFSIYLRREVPVAIKE